MYEDEIPVGNAKDLRGQKFGRWTVLYRVKSTNRQTAWMCECICGTLRKVQANGLISGQTKSCGCYNNELCAELGRKSALDLTGQRFGRLTAIKATQQRNFGNIIWECLCDCGNICYIPTNRLGSNGTQSCGCLHKERMHDLLSLDLTNQRFGKLIAIRKTGNKRGSFNEWLCKCDCGNYHTASSAGLVHGKTASCGCLKSKGELKIKNLLTEAKLNFIAQETFDDCRFIETNYLAFFDFCVEGKYLIEFDGEQHYHSRKQGYFTDDKVQIIKKRDEYKNQWCRENNIPLIRIPYWKLDTLCIEDLMLETTEFRVV